MDNNYNIILDTNEKIKAIKIYMEITGVSLKEAKEKIDNIPGIILDNLSLDEANSIAAKFKAENCEATVCVSSVQTFSDNLINNTHEIHEEVDFSTLSSKNLLTVLKRVKSTIASVVQLQLQMEDADKAVINVQREYASRKTQYGSITFIGLVIGLVLGLIIFSFLGAIIGVIAGGIIGGNINNKRNGAKYLEQAQQYYDEHYPKAEERKNEIQDMVRQLITSSSFSEAQELIPADYFDCDSVDCLIKLIENRRADTIKEAINMYEDILHKNRLEEMQRQQVISSQETANAQKQVAEAVQKQVEYSQQIAKNTRATAKAARLNAFINLVKK